MRDLMHEINYDISVVVPTHNRRRFLDPLLAALARQDYPATGWELIIVDDGSTDGTIEYLEAYKGPMPLNTRYLSQPQSGVAVARNNGAKAARGRAVLFLDDDMVPSPALIASHVDVHLDDRRAVVIGHISVPAEGREPWVAWEDAQLERHYGDLKSGKRQPGPRDLYTGNCSVSTELFRAVGGFDSSLPRSEDVEIGYRLRDASAHFYYRAEADSLHLGRHGFEGWLRNARLYGRMDVLLAGSKGHAELQQEIVAWFHKRSPFTKALVRICCTAPAAEAPAISIFHVVGQLSHGLGASKVSRSCYSAINNLAYWLTLSETIGRERFWSSIRTGLPLEVPSVLAPVGASVAQPPGTAMVAPE
jgi:glycosyltransferase involved in cell wall biosynthesis